jgi:hypothetical protein
MTSKFDKMVALYEAVEPEGEPLTVDDAQNALLHIADDHPCCKESLFAIRKLLLKLEEENEELRARLQA